MLELDGTEEPFCLTVDCDCGVIYAATAIGITGFQPSSQQVSCINVFIPCHRKYSQSEYRKAVVYSTVFNPTFPSCAAVSWYTMEYPTCHLYFLRIQYRENTSDSWDIP